MKFMKICYLTFEFPEDLGGAGRVAKENVHHLADCGYDVDVIAVATQNITSEHSLYNLVHIEKKNTYLGECI